MENTSTLWTEGFTTTDFRWNFSISSSVGVFRFNFSLDFSMVNMLTVFSGSSPQLVRKQPNTMMEIILIIVWHVFWVGYAGALGIDL